MSLLKYPFAGTSGTAIATANSAFSLVQTGGSASATYQSGAAFDGLTGGRFVSDGTNQALANAPLAAAATTAAYSAAVKIPSSVPGADFIFAAVYDTSGARILQLVYKANGNVATNDKANTQITVMTAAQATASTYFRFEIVVTAISATAGAFTVRAYNAANTQVGSTATSSTANLGTVAMSYLRAGALSAPAKTIDVDSIQTNDGASAEIGRWVNVAPTVTPGATQSVQVGSTVTLSATATDSDGIVVSVAWTEDSGPTTPTISNATSTTASFVAASAGTYNMRMTATDDFGATGYGVQTITVTASPPAPPVVSGQVNSNISVIDARASSGGTALTYTISPSTNTSQLAPGVFQVPAGASYTVTATDTYGQSASHLFDAPPVSSGTAARTQIRVGGTWTTLTGS